VAAALELLLAELRKAPSVLRLSYVADTEDAAWSKRVEAIKRQLDRSVGSRELQLVIEPEIFWRLGARPRNPTCAPDGR
jgi:hypothetical protein